MTFSTPAITPNALQPGDTIAIISPAAPSTSEALTAACDYLHERGFTPKLMPHAGATQYYTAGPVEARLSDLHEAFRDPAIQGIICARGGYGAMQLLPHIDWSLVQQNPKVFVGFSDITVLLLGMLDNANLMGFHGPMLTSNLIEQAQTPASSAHLWRLLCGELHTFPAPLQQDIAPSLLPDYHCIRPGDATGTLKGGNLSLLAALCGTPWQPSFEGCLLFIEDWHESYYSIDRQWQQMLHAGLFRGIKGLILGDWAALSDRDDWEAKGYSLAAFFSDLAQQIEPVTGAIPIGLGLPFGHGQESITLPVGCLARFESTRGHLEILASPVAVAATSFHP